MAQKSDDRRQHTSATKSAGLSRPEISVTRQSATASDRVGRLQRLADATSGQGRLAALQRAADARGTIQRKPPKLVKMATAKQNFRDGRLATYMTSTFMGKHVALKVPTTNVVAAEQHASRKDPPEKNTVIMDPVAFKAALAGAAWNETTYKGKKKWSVAAGTELQNTKRRNAIQKPPNPQRLSWIKDNFQSIGAVAMYGNADITSLEDVNQVARRNANVEVRVDQESGNIDHLHRTD